MPEWLERSQLRPDVLLLTGTGRPERSGARPVRVVGLTRNRHAAAVAGTRLDEVLVQDAFGPRLGLPAASFDAVVFEAVPDRGQPLVETLRRLRDLLRPGGVLVVGFNNARHHTVLRALIAGNWEPPSAGIALTRREVEKALYRARCAIADRAMVPGAGHTDWVAHGKPDEVGVGGLRIGPLPPGEAGEFFAERWLVTATPADDPDFGLTSAVVPLTTDRAHLPVRREHLSGTPTSCSSWFWSTTARRTDYRVLRL